MSSTVEGAIAAAEAEAREAETRLSEIEGERLRPDQPSTLRDICVVGDELIGRQSRNSGSDTRTVTSSQFERLTRELTNGASEVDTREDYAGIMYKRSDGSTIGIRRSKRYGLTIDIIDGLGDPAIPLPLRIHSND
jgi:hypothetical protein